MGLNPDYARATEAIDQALRELRSARTVMSDFTLRDEAVAAAEAKLAEAYATRSQIPIRAGEADSE